MLATEDKTLEREGMPGRAVMVSSTVLNTAAIVTSADQGLSVAAFSRVI